MTDNTLYYGDNLAILREHIPDEAGDRVRADVPDRSIAPARDAQEEDDVTLVVIVLNLVSAFWASWIAGKKGRSKLNWFFIGLFAGIFGVIAAAMAKSTAQLHAEEMAKAVRLEEEEALRRATKTGTT